MWSILYIVTFYYNIGWREGGEKACLRDLGVVSVTNFKTRVCLNKFCPRLFDLIYYIIAPGIAKLIFWGARSESFFGKMQKKTRQCHLNNNNKSHIVRYDTI